MNNMNNDNTDAPAVPLYYNIPHSDHSSDNFLRKAFDPEAEVLPASADARTPANLFESGLPSAQTNSSSRRERESSTHSPVTPRSHIPSMDSSMSEDTTGNIPAQPNNTPISHPSTLVENHEPLNNLTYQTAIDSFPITPSTHSNITGDNMMGNNPMGNNTVDNNTMGDGGMSESQSAILADTEIEPLDDTPVETTSNPTVPAVLHEGDRDRNMDRDVEYDPLANNKVVAALVSHDHDNEHRMTVHDPEAMNTTNPTINPGTSSEEDRTMVDKDLPEDPSVGRGRLDIMKGQVKKIVGHIVGDDEKVIEGEELKAKGKREVEIAKEIKE